MVARAILLQLILLLFSNNLIHAQEIDLEENNSSDQDIPVSVSNLPINQHSKPVLIQENTLIDPSNLEYEEKIIHLESNFELSSNSSLTLSSFISPILIKEDYLVVSNESPHSNLELSLASQGYQQTNEQNILHDLDHNEIIIDSPVNWWNLTDKYLALSPFSWHIDYTEPDVNNFPMGVGAAYDFEIINPNYGFFNHLVQDSIVSLEFNIFRDSDFGYPAGYVGLSLRRNIFASPIQMGSAIGLLHTTQLQELSGSPVLPFMLPFLQTDFDIPVNLRIVYIPSFADYNSQQVFFTLMIKVN